MLATGNKSFYTVTDGATHFTTFRLSTNENSGQDDFIILNNIQKSKKIWSNSGGVITDLGDGIINLEFLSKMNTIGGDVLQSH
jgi:3-hydroxyacyl-CoA dehydrogenase